MRTILWFLLCLVAMSSAVALAGPAERLRERELRTISDCDSYAAALDAARPQSFESRLNRFRPQPETEREPEDDRYSARFRPNERHRRAKPMCDGESLRRKTPVFPEGCGGFDCASMLPHACFFVQFGIAETGETTNVTTIKWFPEGASDPLRTLKKNAEDGVRDWCFPARLEPEIVDPHRSNVTVVRYSVVGDPLVWESPLSMEAAHQLAAFYAPLSRRACEIFNNAYAELGGPQKSPSAESDDTVIDAEPLERAAPAWPQSPDAYLYHGCVVVRFDVTETGVVDNAKVIFAAPTRYETTGFQLSTLDAVAKWRYSPATESGTPIRQEGLIATVNFQASSQ